MSEPLLHSQASNFLDCVKTSVDARTGQFTLALALPLPPANQLCGPTLPLTLAFSTLGSTVNRGYGFGWSLGLSEANLDQNGPRLSLGSGEQFAIDWQRTRFEADTPLMFLDQKLNTLIVTQQADGSLRIDKKSGECEVLRVQQPGSARYLLAELRSAEGRRLYFDWLPVGDDDVMLHKVRDETRALLTLTAPEEDLHFTLNPDTPHTTTVKLLMSNGQLNAIEFPGISQPFEVEYDTVPIGNGDHLQLPTRVKSPLGSEEIIHWTQDSEGHPLPEGAPFPYLPRVATWTHSSGVKQAELNHHYQWIGDHNFLGFGSDQAFDWHAGRDNLYEVESDYQYQSVETLVDAEGQTLGRIERIWNRFHLLVSEATRLRHCETRKTTRYGLDPTLSWARQPTWCQLPLDVSVTYVDHARNGARRTETTTYRYDDFGNITQVRHPTGIVESSMYYPVEGAEGCPPDPLGMVRFLRRKTVQPAQAGGDAPTLSTAYTYQPLPSLIEGAPAHRVVASETLVNEQGTVLEHTHLSYVTTPGMAYGRVQRSITTLNGRPTTTEHTYRVAQDELVCQTTIIGFEHDDENRSSCSHAQSLFTGLTRWARSESGALTRYEYDRLGRIVRTLEAVDSDYQTQRRVHYHLGDAMARQLRSADTQPAMMIEQVEVTGRRRRLWLDGDGHTLRVELEDLDVSPGRLREVMRNRFDALGRQTEHVTQDWLAEDQPLVLTTTTAYDDWGQPTLTVNTEGIHSHLRHDPVTLRSEQWQAAGELAGPRQVTQANTAGSPIEQHHYDAEGRLVRTFRQVRDGLDRVIEEQTLVPGSPAIITRNRYDHYSRLIEKRLPDGTLVAWQFAAHSDGQHPESISVTPPAQEPEA